MKGDRDGAMAEIRDLVDLGQSHLVKAHLNDYFGSLRDDPELQSVLA